MENANRPRVSVIVPVFNAADSLPVTIDSVLKQTLTDLELILVNDGSGDASLDICERYAKNDDRIQMKNHHNVKLYRLPPLCVTEFYSHAEEWTPPLTG